MFDDPNINDIFANYTVMHFAKAFPQSGYEHLRKVYKITGNSVGLAQELVSYDSLMFPAFEEIYNPVPLGSFYPNDWNQDWPNDTLQFAFINAHKAWDISKGDTNTIIGITDTYFDVSHEDMQGQYVKVGTNTLPSLPPYRNHGTLVAGIAAAKTNNHKGYPGIGFNCRLQVSSVYGSDNLVLEMVKDKTVNTRVFNASWLNIYGVENLSFKDALRFSRQDVYNEVYENGVVMVAGAGNARTTVIPYVILTKKNRFA